MSRRRLQIHHTNHMSHLSLSITPPTATQYYGQSNERQKLRRRRSSSRGITDVLHSHTNSEVKVKQASKNNQLLVIFCYPFYLRVSRLKFFYSREIYNMKVDSDESDECLKSCDLLLNLHQKPRFLYESGLCATQINESLSAQLAVFKLVMSVGNK